MEANSNLRTPKEACAILNITPKILAAHVRSGELPFVNVGIGKQKPRRRFTQAALNDFIARRTMREAPACHYSNSKTRRSTTTIFGSTNSGFMALRAARNAERQKRLNANSES